MGLERKGKVPLESWTSDRHSVHRVLVWILDEERLRRETLSKTTLKYVYYCWKTSTHASKNFTSCSQDSREFVMLVVEPTEQFADLECLCTKTSCRVSTKSTGFKISALLKRRAKTEKAKRWLDLDCYPHERRNKTARKTPRSKASVWTLEAHKGSAGHWKLFTWLSQKP